jgi:hypothetical protein
MRPQKIKPSKIDRAMFYIVDCYDLTKPRLLWNEFLSFEDAEEGIFKKLDNTSMRYSVVKGSKAIFHKLKFYWDLTFSNKKDRFKRKHWIEITKYNIPPSMANDRYKRIHYRRLVRRRLKKLEKQQKG